MQKLAIPNKSVYVNSYLTILGHLKKISIEISDITGSDSSFHFAFKSSS